MKKIAILLPLKERYRKFDAGSVSLFVHNHLLNSVFRKNIKIYGYQIDKPLDKKKFVRLNSNKFFLTNKSFVNSFIRNIDKDTDLIELHNRPKYFAYLKKKFPQKKFIFFFHNNPDTLLGSRSISEKKYLLKNCNQILFLSQWMKKEFFKDLNVKNSSNTKVFYPGVNPIKKFPKKKKIIVFIGKLNKSKGYDLFLSATSKFVFANKDWKGFSIGHESRRDIPPNTFIKELGTMSNKKVLRFLEKSSIAVASSTSEEPLGRLPLEAASRGSFPIVSKRGGLTETISNKLSILKKNTSDELYKKLLFLKSNPKKLLSFQKNVFKNFKLTLKRQSALLDEVRKFIL